jgi:hypothetical protein
MFRAATGLLRPVVSLAAGVLASTPTAVSLPNLGMLPWLTSVALSDLHRRIPSWPLSLAERISSFAPPPSIGKHDTIAIVELDMDVNASGRRDLPARRKSEPRSVLLLARNADVVERDVFSLQLLHTPQSTRTIRTHLER